MKQSVIALLLFMGALTAQADSVVGKTAPNITIFDNGKTIDAERFYSKITEKAKQAEKVARNTRVLNAPTIDAKPVSIESYFPFQSDMDVGQQQVITVEKLYQPIFIIGLDEDSLGWMRENYSYLSEINAQGIVVAAKSYSDWQEIKMEAADNGINLTVLPGKSIGNVYGLDTYPALLVGEGE